MKKIAVINRHDIYNVNNNLFNKNIYPIGENLEYPILKLKDLFAKENIEICTVDMANIDDFDAAIFLDYPTKKQKHFLYSFKQKKKKLFLITLESPIICSENFNPKNIDFFDLIFTWNENFKNDKIIHIKLPNKIPEKIIFDENHERKLCTIISGNKKIYALKELYSEREKALRWFEKNASHEFDLYGFGWDTLYLRFPFSILKKFPYTKKLFSLKYKTYQGTVTQKIKTLSGYKFSICYENVRGWNGYISEKIFDCFFAGTIPIYLGASNILKCIPKDTFIDKNKFDTYKQLYEYIKTMDEQTYLKHIHAIKHFVEEQKCGDFNAHIFANTICTNIKNKLNQPVFSSYK